MKLSQQQIKQILPHRDPILLIDEVQIAEPGVSGSSVLNVSDDTLLWDSNTREHYVDELILEGAAQLLGIVLATSDESGDDKGQRLLLSFDNIDYFNPPAADQPINVSANIVSQFGAMSAGTFSAQQQHRELVHGKIVIMGN